jgi:diaminopimelate decarboxylase
MAIQIVDDCLSIRDGRLWIEDSDVTELARRHGTPLSVVSEGQLRRNARRIAAAFRAHWPDGEVNVLPSIKANLSPALRSILSEEGMGCDAFGGGELQAALRGGVPPALISVNGPKDQRVVDEAVAVGAKVTLDHADELAMVRAAVHHTGRTAVVRPRVRPDLTSVDVASDWLEEAVPVSRVAQIYKAGIPVEDLLAMGPELLHSDGVRVAGVHVHVGRHRPEPDYWRRVMGEVAALLAELREAWGGWEPAEIDVGGGLPVPRDPFGRDMDRLRDRAPAGSRTAPVEVYADAICGSLRDELRSRGFETEGVTLEVEPGRALYGDAGIHLATVRRIKRQTRPFPWTWVETDSSENFLPDVFLEHNRWFFVVANRASAPVAMHADVVGSSCNPDRILPEAALPAVEPGDVIAVLDTGAYQDALSNNFNALLRPALVLVHGDESEVIRRAETFEEVFARDVVPERLRDRRVIVLEEADRETPTVRGAT